MVVMISLRSILYSVCLIDDPEDRDGSSELGFIPSEELKIFWKL